MDGGQKKKTKKNPNIFQVYIIYEEFEYKHSNLSGFVHDECFFMSQTNAGIISSLFMRSTSAGMKPGKMVCVYTRDLHSFQKATKASVYHNKCSENRELIENSKQKYSKATQQGLLIFFVSKQWHLLSRAAEVIS